HVFACADDTNLMTELDENNNCAVAPGTLVVTLPDLGEISVGNPPANANAGQSITVTDTVHNFGFVTAGASTTRFYLSIDTTKNTGDILLTGGRAVGALAGGGSSAGIATVTISSATPTGTYHLLACADVPDRGRRPERA